MSFYYSEDNQAPSESEWIAREEELERTHEARLRRLDQTFEYPPDACGNCGRVNLKLYDAPDGTYKACDESMEEAHRKLAKPKPVERMQMSLFTEVPNAA